MRAAEFRKDPALVGQWQEMMQNHALLKLVMEVMETEHPTRFIVQGDNDGDISPTMANIALGETRGYSKYANGLRMLATRPSEPKQLPETEYAPDQEEEISQPVTPQPKRRGRPPKRK